MIVVVRRVEEGGVSVEIERPITEPCLWGKSVRAQPSGFMGGSMRAGGTVGVEILMRDDGLTELKHFTSNVEVAQLPVHHSNGG